MGKFFIFFLMVYTLSVDAVLDATSITADGINRHFVLSLIENYPTLENELFVKLTKELIQIFQDWNLDGDNPVHVAAFMSALVDHLNIFVEAKKSIWESYWMLHTEDLLASFSVGTYFFPKVRNFSLEHSDEYSSVYTTNDFVKKIKVSTYDILQHMFYSLPLEERNREEEYKIINLVLLIKISEPCFIEQFRESLRDYYHTRMDKENIQRGRFERLLTKLHLIENPTKPRRIRKDQVLKLIDLPEEDRVYLEFTLMKFISSTLQKVHLVRPRLPKNARSKKAQN